MKGCLILLAWAACLLGHGALDEQIAAASRAIASDPANAQNYIRRGELHRLHQEWTPALADFAQAERANPGEPAYLLGRARVQTDRGEARAAVETLTGYLARRPDSEVALVLRAQCHAKLGEHRRAAGDFGAAIRVSSEPQPDYFLREAQMLAAAGDERGAVAAIDRGLARLGRLPSLTQWVIPYLAARQRYREAIQRLDEMLPGAERKETLLAQRGDLLQAAGRKAEAQEAYRLALAAWERLPDRTRQTRAMTELHARLVRP